MHIGQSRVYNAYNASFKIQFIEYNTQKLRQIIKCIEHNIYDKVHKDMSKSKEATSKSFIFL